MTAHDVAKWLPIVRAEYREIPGLNLTRAQVRRLWNLDEPTTDALLEQLQATRFLRKTRSHEYVVAEAL